MPPKKRSTRGSRKTSKSTKPNCMEDSVSREREEQKQMILKDFDINVTNAVKDIKKVKRTAESAMNKHFDACIQAIPLEIRHMTLKEFAACGGTFEKARESVRKATVTSKLAAIQELNFDPKKLDCGEKYERSVGDITDLGTVQRTIKSKRNTRCRTLLKTPAITPKFDPNLPKTPENVRRFVPGERLMSLAGSPVESRVGQLETGLRGLGVNLDLSPSSMDNLMQDLAGYILNNGT